eukprot:15364893-Ditylum_brightwellii.AAC.3
MEEWAGMKEMEERLEMDEWARILEEQELARKTKEERGAELAKRVAGEVAQRYDRNKAVFEQQHGAEPIPKQLSCNKSSNYPRISNRRSCQ